MLPRLLLVYHSLGYVYDYAGNNNRSNNGECDFFRKNNYYLWAAH